MGKNVAQIDKAAVAESAVTRQYPSDAVTKHKSCIAPDAIIASPPAVAFSQTARFSFGSLGHNAGFALK